MFREGLRIEQQAMLLHRLHMLRPRDQHHLMTGARQHAAVEATDRPRPHDCEFHSLTPSQCKSVYPHHHERYHHS
jgi:hypothetical protein